MGESRHELAFVGRVECLWVDKRGGHMAMHGGLVGDKSPQRHFKEMAQLQKKWGRALLASALETPTRKPYS